MTSPARNTVELPNEIFLGEVKRLIADGHDATLRVRGFSMRPFLEDRRDKIVLTRPTRTVGRDCSRKICIPPYHTHRRRQGDPQGRRQRQRHRTMPHQPHRGRHQAAHTQGQDLLPRRQALALLLGLVAQVAICQTRTAGHPPPIASHLEMRHPIQYYPRLS